MNVKRIDSKQNQKIKWLKKLQQKAKFRREQGLYVVEGYKQVGELDPSRVVTLVLSKEEDIREYERFRMKECLMVSGALFKEVSLDPAPQGIMAVVKMQGLDLFSAELDGDGLYLALDSIQDPGNLGTMIRVSDAVGASGIIMNKTTVDLYNPKVVKSTMGSLEHINCYVVEDLSEALGFLGEKGIVSYGAYLDDSKFHYDYEYNGGTCFVIGNEGNGISDSVIDSVDKKVKIPMPGQSESLNAAVAASVLLYEARRQFDC